MFYNFPIQSFPHISPKPSIPEHITHPKYSQTYKHMQLRKKEKNQSCEHKFFKGLIHKINEEGGQNV